MKNGLLRPSLRFYLYLIKYNPICDNKSQRILSSNHLVLNNTTEKLICYGQFVACRIFPQVQVSKDKKRQLLFMVHDAMPKVFTYEYFYVINAHIIARKLFVFIAHLKFCSYIQNKFEINLSYGVFILLNILIEE